MTDPINKWFNPSLVIGFGLGLMTGGFAWLLHG